MSALGLITDHSDSIGRGQGQRGVKARNQARFLAAFEACGSVAKAARWAKVARTSHFEWLREDPTYRPRFAEADMRAARGLEDEAVRRAREGVRTLVLYRGAPVYIHGEPLYETVYSDRLLERLLEANNPEKFKRHIENTNLLDLDLRQLSAEQLSALAKKWIAEAASSHPELEARRLELEAKVRAIESKAAGIGSAAILIDAEATTVETRST